MNWTCEQIEERLSDQLDGQLTATELEAFLEHLRGCAPCAGLLARVSQALAGLREIGAVEEPPRLVYNILDQTLGKRESAAGWSVALGFLRGLASPKFAYGAMSVAATLALLLTAAGFSGSRPQLADLHPAQIYRNADRQAHLIYARGTRYVNDLRVVYEIQSRLRPEGEMPSAPENGAPDSSPKTRPDDVTDGPQKSAPRHYNRANDLQRIVTVLASQVTALSPRSLR
ncbi:MAG: zf-HC2 domain-containing protein [Acidobacteriia bacterium]|nr:zf-HC2 domain-containing protein [Terriglobia bacterium]